jgi:hypothetical protein
MLSGVGEKDCVKSWENLRPEAFLFKEILSPGFFNIDQAH